jgi:hypothetical protein
MLYTEIMAVCSQIHTKHINTLCGQNVGLVGPIAKWRKATVGFVMSVRPSVHTQQLRSHWTNFHDISYLRIFRKSVEKIRISLKSEKNIVFFSWTPTHIYVAQCFLEWEMFQPKVPGTIKTHILCSIAFPPLKSSCLWDNVENVDRPQMTIC